MFALKRLVPAALLAMLTTVAACGESLSPDDVDPEALQASVANAADVFTGNASLQSVATLSDNFPLFGSPAISLLRSSMLRAFDPRSAAAARATVDASRILASRSSSSSHPQALFPSDALGKTFVWDTGTSAYIVGPATGAPANGIRIVLYFANAATGQPFLPLTPIGNLDLTDKSSPQADKLGITLTFSSTTVAAYDITVVSGQTAASATAAGYVRSAVNTERADFNFVDALSLTTGGIRLVSTNHLTGGGAAIHVVLTVPDISEDQGSLVCSVAKDGNGLELTVTGALGNQTGPVSGGVKFNGTTVANLAGTFEDPSITGSGGHTLTQAQVGALVFIFDSAVDFAIAFSSAVFAPGTIVF